MLSYFFHEVLFELPWNFDTSMKILTFYESKFEMKFKFPFQQLEHFL